MNLFTVGKRSSKDGTRFENSILIKLIFLWNVPHIKYLKMEQCIICQDEIGTKNVAVTPCGHQFCFTCMAKALSCNNTCPMCRAVLVIQEDEEDEEDEFFYNEDSDNEEEEEEEEEEEQTPTVELITEKFLASGYSAADLVSLLTGRYKRQENNEKYTEEYKNEMSLKFDQICEEVDISVFADMNDVSKEKENKSILDVLSVHKSASCSSPQDNDSLCVNSSSSNSSVNDKCSTKDTLESYSNEVS